MSYPTLLRQLRRRWAVSQGELADLLGVSQSVISRCEAGTAHPDLPVAFGLQVVFGETPKRLFARLFAQIEERVMAQAAELDRKIGVEPGHPAVLKRRLLTGMAHRASGNRSPA